MWVRSLGREDPLEDRMATLSSILAWETQWTEESVATVHAVARELDVTATAQQRSSVRFTGSSHLKAVLKRGSRGLAREAQEAGGSVEES